MPPGFLEIFTASEGKRGPESAEASKKREFSRSAEVLSICALISSINSPLENI